ncbi:response regulator transcription factor [Fictibacillus fluitans]|uniref:Response regulator transcription factor n=1 Tax=Fictibacillus fluitans TaxID=3058422 RepID=A0ABT8HRD1_9BACL|nr:response regulator transcription factor [Fictibacillus sp. NE201]MDN4523326.1 response regulator transcription factor [Fictibacillus sp. NE201]
MKHIFVIDDEKSIRDILQKYLQKEGYKVTVFSEGFGVEAEMLRLRPDLLVLDIMMPGIDGIELCREIRRKSEIPIIFISARDAELDRILGLELGGDDYLTKPFSPRELVARIKNIFKRIEKIHAQKPTEWGNVKVDLNLRQVKAGETEISLTAKEYDLFSFLFSHPGQPFTREQLIEKIWGYTYAGDGRLIDDLVKRLRKKLTVTKVSIAISTVWGYGYRMEEQHEDW